MSPIREAIREFPIESCVIAGLLALLVALCVWKATRPDRRVIDGCEYIVSHGAYHTSLTHKGNCTNSIHR